MNVDYCNGKACKINSEALHEKVMKECESLFGIKLKRNLFFGPQPVAVEKRDFAEDGKLRNNKYVVCEKSDGERGILILINIDSKPMCFMMNRSTELLFLSLSFKREVFEGTIFDGEIIKTKNGTWNYLIHDCMFYNGRSFIGIIHPLRYSAVLDFITKRYVNKETDPFNIKTKIFYNYLPNKLNETWKHINENTENNIDGLIFTPINDSIKFGRQYSLLKWKEPNNHTIDFLVKNNKKMVILYYLKNNNNEVFKIFKPVENNYSVLFTFLEQNGISLKPKDSLIIEFKYLPNGEIFTPYRIRTDKSVPNGDITLKNTIKNIEESINISDFC